MTGSRDALDRQAAALGIAPGYYDIGGTWHEVSEETTRALVAAMGGEVRAPYPKAAVGATECHLPAALRKGGRIWGFAVQLYGLRSHRNWGIGDFGDLRRLVRLAARLRASAIQLSPLHALFPWWPDHVSPYAPSSRLFLNPLYIDVEAIPDYDECASVRELVDSAGFRATLEGLRETDVVDYRAVSEHKLRALRLLYEFFRQRHLSAPVSQRGAAFHAFRAEEGAALADFAAFEALSARFSASAGPWQRWPEAYRNPRSPAVQRFAEAEGASEAGFSAWMQWLALGQLFDVSALARELGMTVGLIGDLALGSDLAGADSWRDQALFALNVELGAPPDPFNDKGQTWGIAPWRPLELGGRAGEPLANLLDATMRWAGGVRVDHIMGLERQFWVPRGSPGSEGAYVAYPLDDLLAVLAQASARHRCLVIGEDLGTVPEGFRERMRAAKALSTRVLYFERDAAGGFRRPRDYPELAAVSASTHDLPTLAGFLSGFDLDARAALGHYESQEAEHAARAARRDAVARLTAALRSEGLLYGAADASSPLDAAEVCRAVHAFLTRSSSAVALVQLEDVLAVPEQANLPGTTDEYPNWRRKLPVTLEAMESSSEFDALAAIMAERTSPAKPS